jgi:phosphoenolpyruvate synthase/pyruvate phosphate dikinase
MSNSTFIRKFEDLSNKAVSSVGGKNASPGEMIGSHEDVQQKICLSINGERKMG